MSEFGADCTPMMEVSKHEAAKSEFMIMMDVVEVEYVESQMKEESANHDELLVADTIPDFVDVADLLGDENNLLFGNALVSVFDDSI